ncbi:MAG: tetratricopeptide repeat protein [Bryobacteraceae bacterium]|nr:tetratricopeptide repeat protein [Bryobacteraceae bacterium]
MTIILTLLTALTAAANEPAPRHLERVVVDSHRKALLVYGGAIYAPGEPVTFPADSWHWSGGTWRTAPAEPGPGARAGHALVYDRHRKRVVVLGGMRVEGGRETELRDVCSTDEGSRGARSSCGSSPAESSASCRQPGPQPAGPHEAAFDSHRAALVISTWKDDRAVVWEWHGGSWSQKPCVGACPPPRDRFAAAYDERTRKTMLFGGRGPRQPALGDLWGWDGEVWSEWRGTANAPAPRAAAALEAGSGEVYLYGGVTGWGPTNELWRWKDGEWRLLNAAGAMDAERTVAALRARLASKPEDWDAAARLGGVLKYMGRYDEAQPVLERAHQGKPGDHNHLFSLLEVLYQLKKDREAEQVLEAALASGRVASYRRLGTLLSSIGREREAALCTAKAEAGVR